LPRGEGAIPSRLTFVCNVCGTANDRPAADFDRETESCGGCGSTVRMRSIIHVLALELFGRCLPISDFPPRPDLRGLGTSDWAGYATRLARRLDYTNTFFHQEPRLDLRDPDPRRFGTLDFLISTDVFEHVAPPVELAFSTARRLLKPTGVFVFSVPYGPSGPTREHFPDLHDWTLERAAGREPVLRNLTRDGRVQEFRDLVFHGGDGATLEMRVFSLPGIQELAATSGFLPPRVHSESHLECGMVWSAGWSQTMALRPAPSRTG
jgi:SAM-dependent methyltransferase